MFRQMLMGGASRAMFAPETDDGFDDDELDPADAGADDELDELDPDDGEGLDPDEEPEEPEAPPARRGRDENMAALRETARLAKDRADAADRELASFRTAQARETSQLTEQQERERLSLMTTDEKLEYLLAKQQQQTDQKLYAIQFQSWDSNDKAAFAALAARTPAVAAIADEVEAGFAEMARANKATDRATIAAFLIGQKALAKAPRARAAGARAAAAGRERQHARPASGRGDVATGGARQTNERAARAKRLEGVEI